MCLGCFDCERGVQRVVQGYHACNLQAHRVQTRSSGGCDLNDKCLSNFEVCFGGSLKATESNDCIGVFVSLVGASFLVVFAAS